MVRVGERWTEVKGFQIIDSRKCAVLVGAIGQLTVPGSRITWNPTKYRFELQPKDSTENHAI